MVWEFVFLMLILKIPIVYLAAVVYWAIKAEPNPPEGAALGARVHAPDPRTWQPVRPRNSRSGPHGAPSRGYRPGRAPAAARADAR